MTTEQTTALALRPVQLVHQASPLPTAREISVIEKAAAMAYQGFLALPKELNSPQKVAAVMMYGWELGLKPMTALQELYIVNGRVAPSSGVMAGLVMRAEPDIRILIEELSDERCTMRIQRPSRHISEPYTVTWDDIVKAGLARGQNLQYPQDRLRYHCTKRLLRTYAPDLINGLGGDNFEGRALDGSDERWTVEEDLSEDELYNEGEAIAAPVVPAPISEATRKLIAKHWDPKHPNVEVLRQRWAAAFPVPGTGGVNDTKKLSESDGLEVVALLHDWAYDEKATLMVCTKCGIKAEEPTPAEQGALV